MTGNLDQRCRNEAPPSPVLFARGTQEGCRGEWGSEEGSWGEGGGGLVAAALLSGTGRPGERGARTSIRTVFFPAEPALRAMSQSRHRAAAPPLEHEDSGTFRSARGQSAVHSWAEWWAGEAGAWDLALPRHCG